MDKTILFPHRASDTIWSGTAEQYYLTHYSHIKNYLTYVGKVEIIRKDTTIWDGQHNNNFYVDIDDKRIVFDYSDFSYHTMYHNLPDNIKYFKIHTTKKSDSRCLPFPPMSFVNWDQYYQLKKDIQYNPYGKIYCKCRIYGGAVERRQHAINLLRNMTGTQVDFNFVPQNQYFNSFNNCKINVVVPGARPDILDRTHMQSFALGIPVISSYITTLLPYGEQWEPNVDYILCNDNFDNVIECINKIKNDTEKLKYISNNCKAKFESLCSPPKVKDWILYNI